MVESQKIFIVDNYDSFTYNLVHYVESFDAQVTVKRNDKFELSELENYDKIVFSPGPGLPKDAGLLMKVIEEYHKTKPIFGVCLGHQALAEFFGAQLINLKEVHHGVSSKIEIDTSHFLFKDLSPIQEVGRYHSWAISDWPNSLKEIGYTTDDYTNMAFAHKQYNCIGVQFHPESVLTPQGLKMIENWLSNS
ncbi:MAG: anthranilate synthase component II [Flavobacteriales bacterium]